MQSSAWRFLALTLAAMLAVLCGGFVLQAGLLNWGWSDMQMGTVPDWIAAAGGIATVGALIVAWLVYRKDSRDRARDENARANEDKQRQAELITACLNDHIEVGLRPSLEHYVRMDIFNASQGVVYDIFVRVIGEPDDSISVGGRAPEHREARGFMHVLPPGTHPVTMRMPDITERVLGLELYFRDARNQRWVRDTSGILEQTEGDPFPVVRDAFWRVTAEPMAKPHIEIQILHEDQ